ncbi:MAG TPA: thioredoxin TrxC [Blastocatellia bacterium]|nr:thioredoxin TrxC [Blastocatellia bacterium]
MSATKESKIIQCPKCGANNRVPEEKIRAGLEPVCGRCKSPLAASTHPVIVTDANFAEEVERSPLPVLLDMWAPWCGPCRMIAPVIEQLAAELAGRVKVAKLNTDENPMTGSRFNVRSIPTLLVLKDGKEVDRLVGAMPKQEILRRLAPVIG